MLSTSVTLIERVCTSTDDHAWQRFVELYTPLLFYWARRTGCEANDAADLVQEVFTHLLDKLPQYQHNHVGKFRSWLRTVAHNCWHNYHRRRTLPRDDDASLKDIPAPDDQFWETDYKIQLTRKALALIQTDFAPQTWQAFWQTMVDGQAPTEVAQVLGISVASVYQARSRVLSRLRQEFSGLFD